MPRCDHFLGRLPCVNPKPHEGGEHGRGCVHETGSGVPSERHEDDGGN